MWTESAPEGARRDQVPSGDPVRTDDPEEHREAGLRPHPALSEVLGPDAAPDIAHRHDGDDDVIHRPEDGDELRDEVDRRHDPGDQPDQHQAERRVARCDRRSANEAAAGCPGSGRGAHEPRRPWVEGPRRRPAARPTARPGQGGWRRPSRVPRRRATRCPASPCARGSGGPPRGRRRRTRTWPGRPSGRGTGGRRC